MLRALVCDPIGEKAVEMLTSAGIHVDSKPAITAEELERSVASYNILLVRGRTKVTARVIELGSPNLKIVGRAGVGLDNIDLEAAARHGVKVLNTPEAPTNAVAELVIGMMICLARNIPAADRVVRSGGWPKHAGMGLELAGKTLGVVGFGRIGRRVAEIAHAIGMTVQAYDIIEIPTQVLEKTRTKLVDLETILKTSDFITLHVPLTKETYHMLDASKLRMIRPTSYLINVSRGAVVDEEALYDALAQGWIAGAGLDVFEHEPPTGSKLLSLDNVVLTPHIGAQTREAQEAAATMLAGKILDELGLR
jgi:D-3-phosphoglycerate dehydrogenase